jgi:uracil-DNA glycosylase
LGAARRLQSARSPGPAQVVFGASDPAADLMTVGEGPGQQGDSQGIRS